ncbi:MAG: ComEC/Rec2 family competence protein [Planctomycetota bacterium]|nr:MAG: ComEC/Rec2 family competence protein [Planctomycetota bacterium]
MEGKASKNRFCIVYTRLEGLAFIWEGKSYLLLFLAISEGILIWDSCYFSNFRIILPGFVLAVLLVGLVFVADQRWRKVSFLCFGLILGFIQGWRNYASPQEIRSEKKKVLEGEVLLPVWREEREEKARTKFFWETAEGRYYVVLDFSLKDLGWGEFIALEGVCFPPQQRRNPYQFNFGQKLLRQGVQGIVYVKGPSQIISRRIDSVLWEAIFELREGFLEKLEILSTPFREVAMAMLFGERREGLKETYEDFQRAGTAHFFALSGLHFAILLGGIWGIFRLLGCSWRFSCFGVMVGATFYLGLCGFSVSLIRAYIMALFLLLGWYSGMPISSWNLLGLAGVVIVSLWPHQLFEVGFQLSFAAVAGILLFAERCYKRLQSCNPWLNYFLKIFSVGLSAWFTTMPLIALYFHRFTPLALGGNFLLSLWVGIAIGSGFGYVFLATFFPGWQELVARWVEWIFAVFIRANSIFARFDFFLLPPDEADLVFFYLVLLVICAWPKYRRSCLKVALTVMLLCWVGNLWRVRGLEITCLDVGHGLSVLVRTKAGKWIVYDAGSRRDFDLTRALLAPTLRRKGTLRIDILILSHPHLDHIRGVRRLVEEVEVGEVWVSRYFGCVLSGRRLLYFLRSRGIFVRIVSGGESFEWGKGEGIEVLSPPVLGKFAPLVSPNNASLAVKIKSHGRSLLFLGDLEDWGIGYLLRRKDLRSDVVFLPHHGGKLSLYPELFQATRARFYINSSDRPISAYVRRYLKKLSFYSTYRWGCIELKFLGKRWKLNLFLRDSLEEVEESQGSRR